MQTNSWATDHLSVCLYLLLSRQPDVVVQAGVFQLTLPVNSIITITSLRTLGMHGVHPAPPEPQPFPFPYQENFDGEKTIERCPTVQVTVYDGSVVECRCS